MNDSLDVDNLVLFHYRHNMLVNILDVTFFFLGYAFISTSTILPLFVSHLTDNKVWIGLIGMISATGFFLPQLFTANWVERSPIKRDIVVKVGFFTERLPVFFLPISALMALFNPLYALALFFLFFGWHNFGAGTTAVAWQDMVAKIFPTDRRGFFWGVGSFGGTATGVLGAFIAAELLDQFPYPYGYAMCFGIAGVCILVSWFFLRMTREEPSERPAQVTSTKEYFRKLPAILKRDHNFRWFLTCQVLLSFGGMAWGFLAVFAVDRWQLSDGYVGTFATALLIGQSIGNLLFGMMGDRKGYWLVIICGAAVGFITLLLPLFVSDPVWFYLVFGLRGVSLGAANMTLLIAMEFCTPDIRPTYIGISNTTLGLVGIFAPVLGGILAQQAGYEPLYICAAVLTAIGLLFFIFTVREPRENPPLYKDEMIKSTGK
jgi:MFS family permease